jgi:hypothetical protein
VKSKEKEPVWPLPGSGQNVEKNAKQIEIKYHMIVGSYIYFLIK